MCRGEPMPIHRLGGLPQNATAGGALCAGALHGIFYPALPVPAFAGSEAALLTLLHASYRCRIEEGEPV